MKQGDEGRANLGYTARAFERKERKRGKEWRGGREKKREWKNEKDPRKGGGRRRAGERRRRGREGHPSPLEKLALGKCVLTLTIATHQN